MAEKKLNELKPGQFFLTKEKLVGVYVGKGRVVVLGMLDDSKKGFYLSLDPTVGHVHRDVDIEPLDADLYLGDKCIFRVHKDRYQK